MNLRYEILKACAANHGAPVDEIADAIKHDRKKTGWAVRDCAKEGLLSKRLDDVTSQLGYTLTAAGKKRLAEGPATRQGSNMKRGDSEGGETDVKPQSAEIPPQIPPPQYDPDAVAFAKPGKIEISMRREITQRDDALKMMDEQVTRAAEVLAPCVAGSIDSSDMSLIEIAEAVAGHVADLALKLGQQTDELRNLRALNEKLEHLLQSARNEDEHLRRYADHSSVDMVNHPPHYQGKVECIDAIESALGPDGFRAYCRGTAMKYAWRAGKKGDASEDMAKGAWYLSRAANINKEQQQ
jgi:hypothetical protein